MHCNAFCVVAHLINVIRVGGHPWILVQGDWEWLLFQLIDGRNLNDFKLN